jgi:hypothetical protein
MLPFDVPSVFLELQNKPDNHHTKKFDYERFLVGSESICNFFFISLKFF